MIGNDFPTKSLPHAAYYSTMPIRVTAYPMGNPTGNTLGGILLDMLWGIPNSTLAYFKFFTYTCQARLQPGFQKCPKSVTIVTTSKSNLTCSNYLKGSQTLEFHGITSKLHSNLCDVEEKSDVTVFLKVKYTHEPVNLTKNRSKNPFNLFKFQTTNYL